MAIEAAVRTSGIASQQEVLDAAVRLLRAADTGSPGIEGGLVGKIDAAGGKVLVIQNNYGPVNM
jgi:hypothetical protein